eukprot:TRINITY_DN1440_c0_g1_i1.p1 TRINITY_DN1440_c0_g1~~TRINITY_DN1440_c0_g1_i1.p1  ORF type:complete len:574 (-),score=106.46 TRINITY_DN1440_c0_g1_i1:118-1641(-)
MNAYPLQNTFGGPNYFSLSTDHFYVLNIDTDGDAVADHEFRFFFEHVFGGAERTFFTIDDDVCATDSSVIEETGPGGITVEVGTGDQKKNQPIPLKFAGPLSFGSEGALNWFEYYHIMDESGANLTHPADSNLNPSTFRKPMDYAGENTFGDADAYEEYASNFFYPLELNTCSENARVFVGQRRESFPVNIGKIFDLVNLNPFTINNCEKNDALKDFAVTSFVIEIPLSCISGEGTIGVWGTVHDLVHEGGAHTVGRQISRLGNPLIGELVIGIPEKGLFNSIPPTQDQTYPDIVSYVTHPSLPAIISLILTGDPHTVEPSNLPRLDLVITFLTGIPGINELNTLSAGSEMLRLNTGIAPVAAGEQNPLGVIAGDLAGFPNGRRPGDDIVDVALRVMMGVLCVSGLNDTFGCGPQHVPLAMPGQPGLELTDGAPNNAGRFKTQFPYLQTPKPGAVATDFCVPIPPPEECEECEMCPPPKPECPCNSDGTVINLNFDGMIPGDSCCGY